MKSLWYALILPFLICLNSYAYYYCREEWLDESTGATYYLFYDRHTGLPHICNKQRYDFFQENGFGRLAQLPI